MIGAAASDGARARRAHRDVLDRFLDGRRPCRRAAATARARRSLPSRRASTACGCAGRFPNARHAERIARSISSCSPRPTARPHRYAKIHPVRVRRRARALRGGRRVPHRRRRGRPVQLLRVLRPAVRGRVLAARAGTDCYVVVANWPRQRRAHWSALLRARAIENQAFVVGVNRVGHRRRAHLRGRLGDPGSAR